MFDHCGRPKGDPAFGQPAGVDTKTKKKNMKADDDDNDDDDEVNAAEAGGGKKAVASKVVALGEELMAGSMGGEITGKGKKFKSQTRRWFVLTEKYLAVFKDEQSTDDRLSLVPLPLCQVRERPKTKRKKEPHAFRWVGCVKIPRTISSSLSYPAVASQHNLYVLSSLLTACCRRTHLRCQQKCILRPRLITVPIFPYYGRVDVTNSMKVAGDPISKMILDPGDLESRCVYLRTLVLPCGVALTRHPVHISTTSCQLHCTAVRDFPPMRTSSV